MEKESESTSRVFSTRPGRGHDNMENRPYLLPPMTSQHQDKRRKAIAFAVVWLVRELQFVVSVWPPAYERTIRQSGEIGNMTIMALSLHSIPTISLPFVLASQLKMYQEKSLSIANGMRAKVKKRVA